MTIYGISTLLLYESLSMRASSIVFSSSPQNQELGNAYDCAREAIKYAFAQSLHCFQRFYCMVHVNWLLSAEWQTSQEIQQPSAQPS